jgi:hypothetical protein
MKCNNNEISDSTPEIHQGSNEAASVVSGHAHDEGLGAMQAESGPTLAASTASESDRARGSESSSGPFGWVFSGWFNTRRGKKE